METKERVMKDKYEEARIISARAFQLAVGAPPMGKTKPTERFEEVARREYEKGVVPLKVLRVKKQ